MDSAAPMVPIERKSSIEKEPRTLNIQQIQVAREAALYVVSTRSVEEALRIFTAGLEPVMSCGHGNGGSMLDYDEEEEEEEVVKHYNSIYIHGLRRGKEPRDIASAPF